MNPLLADDELPRFDAIRAEHVTPAVDILLADAEAALVRAVGDTVPATHRALGVALDVPVERLMRVWGIVVHLHGVIDTPDLRAAFDANLPRIVDFTTRLAAHQRLFAKIRTVADADTTLDAVQRKAVGDALRDFVLGGAELVGARRERFAQIAARCAALSQRFGENVLDATDAWVLDVDDAELDGVPPDVVDRARAEAQAVGASGCRLTLHAPCREAILRHATHRPLRRAVFLAKAQLCSHAGAAAHDNGPLMHELVQLRREQAHLLGHADYASLSLVPKMARDPQQVIDFLRELAQRARPFAETELADLRVFAERELGLADLQPWDRDFAAEQLKQARHGLGQEQLRPYFPAPRVIDGCLRLFEQLFGVRFAPVDAPRWHPDVRVFGVHRGTQLVGHVGLDLYARAGKQSGAWMEEATHRWRRPGDGVVQRPLAYLLCNFAPPHRDRPCLLTHDDLITLFHEFGHGLHHLLTQVDELSLSGIGGVEWDAAELPSQFMENYCWNRDVLQRLSAHVDTGEPLPRALFERLRAGRNFGSALRLLRHVEFALFDMRLHGAPVGATVAGVAGEVRREVSLFEEDDGVRYPNTFTHLFDGGYAAGYYGYAWAEVLSADAFSAFDGVGPFDPDTGRRWRETVLERGGSRPALDNFIAFRGRPPKLDAFLRDHGLLEPQAALS